MVTAFFDFKQIGPFVMKQQAFPDIIKADALTC